MLNVEHWVLNVMIVLNHHSLSFSLYYWLTELAIVTRAELSSEPLFNKQMKTITKWLQLYLIYNLIYEGKFQKKFCFLLTDTTLLHIEHCRIVQLPYGRAM